MIWLYPIGFLLVYELIALIFGLELLSNMVWDLTDQKPSFRLDLILAVGLLCGHLLDPINTPSKHRGIRKYFSYFMLLVFVVLAYEFIAVVAGLPLLSSIPYALPLPDTALIILTFIVGFLIARANWPRHAKNQRRKI